MKLKKLIPELVEGIVEAGYDKEPREIQGRVVSGIKSGRDLFVVAPNGEGKTTALNIGLIQQLKQAFEKAPRALVIVGDRDKAFAFDEEFEMLAKHTDLRSLLVYDQGNLTYQKDMIYEGIDVLITTPKRLNQLLNNSGVNITKVKMLIVDDSEEVLLGQNHTIIHRLADSIDKLHIVISSSHWVSKLDSLTGRVMKNPTIVKPA